MPTLKFWNKLGKEKDQAKKALETKSSDDSIESTGSEELKPAKQVSKKVENTQAVEKINEPKKDAINKLNLRTETCDSSPLSPLDALDKFFGRKPLLIEETPEVFTGEEDKDDVSVERRTTDIENDNGDQTNHPQSVFRSLLTSAPTLDTAFTSPTIFAVNNVCHCPTLNTNADIDQRAQSLDSSVSSKIYLKGDSIDSTSCGTYHIGMENSKPKDTNIQAVSTDSGDDSKISPTKAYVPQEPEQVGTSTNALIQQLMHKIIDMDKKMSDMQRSLNELVDMNQL